MLDGDLTFNTAFFPTRARCELSRSLLEGRPWTSRLFEAVQFFSSNAILAPSLRSKFEHGEGLILLKIRGLGERQNGKRQIGLRSN